MHIQAVIEQLGYHPNHAKIYLAALKVGETTIAELASQVGMPRTTIKECLDEMHKHGLMNYYMKRGRKYWTAENPDKFLIILKEREAALKSILPSLHALTYESGGGKPSIKYYIGAEEIKLIFDDMIETKHHIMAMMSWDDIKELMGKGFIRDFIERRYTHFLKIRLITPKTESAIALQRHDGKESRQTRFLPSHIELRRVSNYIYDGKIAIISMNKKEPTGILIQDPDVVHANMIYFESLWHHSSEQ